MHTTKERITIEKCLYYFSILFFVGSLSFFFYYMNGHINSLLDSDDSSDMVLSQLLSGEGGFLSENWFYSTELRVLHSQIPASLFFRLTDNWKTVRLLTLGSLYLLVYLSLYFMLRQFRVKQSFFAVAGILSIPFSTEYFYFVQKVHYLPHIIVAFTTIGLLEGIIRKDNRQKTKIFYMIVSAVLSFFAGLGGARLICVLYLPVFLAGLFLLLYFTVAIVDDGNEKRISIDFSGLSHENRLFSIMAVLDFFFSVTGFMINMKILSQKYYFFQYNIEFAGFDITRFSRILAGFINSIGYTNDSVFSAALLNNAIAAYLFFIFVLSVAIAILHRKDKTAASDALFRYCMICICAALTLVLLYTFTDMNYDDRYNLICVVMFFPLLVLAMRQSRFEKKTKTVFILLTIFLLLFNGAAFYKTLWKTDETSEMRKIFELLTEEGYQNGYSTFWNANLLTELSNGSIEVWDWGDMCTFDSIDQTYHWLQKKNHVTEHPKGKVFWILDNEDELFHYDEKISSDHLLYESPKDMNWDAFEEDDEVLEYKVYGFSNYDQMYYLAGIYDQKEAFSVLAGKTEKASPTVLYPDTYTMVCTGGNLDTVDVALEYKKIVKYKGNDVVWNRPFDMKCDSVQRGTDYYLCRFTLDEIAKDFQPCFTNHGSNEAKIASVKIYKGYLYYSDFWHDIFLENGYNLRGERHLHEGGISYGPYITLVPGIYLVECKGENLDQVSFDFVYSKGAVLENIELLDVEQTSDHIKYRIKIDEVSENCEVRFFNHSEEECLLSEVTIVLAE